MAIIVGLPGAILDLVSAHLKYEAVRYASNLAAALAERESAFNRMIEAAEEVEMLVRAGIDRREEGE